jgi:hypothetical protein
MAVSDQQADVNRLDALVGHPGDKWNALKARIQNEAVKEFSAVQDEWLDVLYTLDSYRHESVVPRGMGNQRIEPGKRLAGIYRNKGNWYADLIAVLLSNRTTQKLAPRPRVEGFSQLHQIDVAWPDRSAKPIQDPLICLETKVTGAPDYGGTAQRGAMADWTNRRKELKFAATDLKLNRRQSETTIDHWDVWRLREMPKCYFLWGARLTAKDNITKMIREVQALTMTYLDGAGIFAWRLVGSKYEPINITSKSPADRVSTVDDLLRRISDEIKQLAPQGEPPPPQLPPSKAIDVSKLDDDLDESVPL